MEFFILNKSFFIVIYEDKERSVVIIIYLKHYIQYKHIESNHLTSNTSSYFFTVTGVVYLGNAINPIIKIKSSINLSKSSTALIQKKSV